MRTRRIIHQKMIFGVLGILLLAVSIALRYLYPDSYGSDVNIVCLSFASQACLIVYLLNVHKNVDMVCNNLVFFKNNESAFKSFSSFTYMVVTGRSSEKERELMIAVTDCINISRNVVLIISLIGVFINTVYIYIVYLYSLAGSMLLIAFIVNVYATMVVILTYHQTILSARSLFNRLTLSEVKHNEAN